MSPEVMRATMVVNGFDIAAFRCCNTNEVNTNFSPMNMYVD